MGSMDAIVLTADREKALEYLENWLDVSPLVRQLGLGRLSSECGRLELVCGSTPPPSQDYSSGWGADGTLTTPWLTRQILDCLEHSPDSLVLLEDISSSPSDTFLTTRTHPPYLSFNGRVFWPIFDSIANADSIEKIRSWCAAFREIVIFTKFPVQLSRPLETSMLFEKAFESIAFTTSRIITDVFDGEGYLDWHRRS